MAELFSARALTPTATEPPVPSPLAFLFAFAPSPRAMPVQFALPPFCAHPGWLLLYVPDGVWHRIGQLMG